MAKRIKVSVVLPVYNGERYLRKCLDDILGQSLREIEVICVDDGSTDGTLAILKEYEKADPRVRAVYQDNAGAAVARNYGMTLAGESTFHFWMQMIFLREICCALPLKMRSASRRIL